MKNIGYIETKNSAEFDYSIKELKTVFDDIMKYGCCSVALVNWVLHRKLQNHPGAIIIMDQVCRDLKEHRGVDGYRKFRSQFTCKRRK